MPISVAILTIEKREFDKDYANPAPSFGTAPEALLQGFAGLPEIKIHVVCCLQQPPVSSPERLAENIWYHALHVPKTGWMRTGYQGCIRAVRRKLKEIQPDLVHGQGTERDCAISAVFSGFPNVLTIHGNMRLVAKINRALPFSFEWLAARLENFTLPRTGGIVCITAYTQRAVAPLARATWIVPNAVDASFFAIEPQPAAPREIVCVGQISTRKNQVRLIEALQPLAAKEKFQLVFYGGAIPGDPYAREFFQKVEENPWCRFAGFADRAGLRTALARAAMLVLPSLEDNCPMCVLEAMAAGVPVAAAAVGGVPELIKDKVDGVLFDPNENESIRSAVEGVFLHQDISAKLAAAGKAKALACFHPKSIATQHVEIYREVLSRKGRQ
jgi:glycosyltransferase involved in cell wall biosynthesis